MHKDKKSDPYMSNRCQKQLDRAMHESRGTVMLFAGNYTCVIEKTTNSGYPKSAVFY